MRLDILNLLVLAIGSTFLNSAFLYKIPWCAVVGGSIFAAVIWCDVNL